jgi:hypothetical protein
MFELILKEWQLGTTGMGSAKKQWILIIGKVTNNVEGIWMPLENVQLSKIEGTPQMLVHH